MKKIILFATAGMLTTATIVYATKANERTKTKKEAVAKKEGSCTKHAKRTCIL